MAQPAPPRDAQVVIVGGGPVGMGLAIELGQRGIRCVVVERYPTPQPIPKGQNLTQRTMEHFHFWGAEPALRAARTIPPEYGIGGLTAYGTLLGDYHYDWLQRALVQPYYFQRNERLPQYATEAVLRSRVAELPTVQVLYGWTAEAVETGEDAVAVTIAGPEGARRTLHAAYLVGCDGSRSLVRTHAGITQTLSDHDRLMVLLVFRSERLHALLARYPGKSYYNVLDPALEGYWKFFGRVDLGSTWFFHAPVPPGTTRDNFDFRRYVHEAVGAEFDVDFEHIGFWDLRFAIADQYRDRTGRVFVAGDAAHSHPPYGGYGVNTGFEDARNLGWKLAAVLQGWGGAALLESYEAERRPVHRMVLDEAVANHALLGNQLWTEGLEDATAQGEALRATVGARIQAAKVREFATLGVVKGYRYDDSPVVVPDGSPAPGQDYINYVPTSRPGAIAPHAWLHDGSSLYDHFGDGFTLLVRDAAGEVAQRARAEAQAAGVPLVVIAPTEAGVAAQYPAAATLVRPDQHVAWRGDAWPAGLLARVTGQGVHATQASHNDKVTA